MITRYADRSRILPFDIVPPPLPLSLVQEVNIFSLKSWLDLLQLSSSSSSDRFSPHLISNFVYRLAPHQLGQWPNTTRAKDL